MKDNFLGFPFAQTKDKRRNQPNNTIRISKGMQQASPKKDETGFCLPSD